MMIPPLRRRRGSTAVVFDPSGIPDVSSFFPGESRGYSFRPRSSSTASLFARDGQRRSSLRGRGLRPAPAHNANAHAGAAAAAPPRGPAGGVREVGRGGARVAVLGVVVVLLLLPSPPGSATTTGGGFDGFDGLHGGYCCLLSLFSASARLLCKILEGRLNFQ